MVTLQAIAYLSTMMDSPVAAHAYTLTACATPTYSLAPGNYSTPQTVAISTTTGGATICYTTDGSTPTETHGTVYTGPVTFSINITLQALAWKPGMGDSAVATQSYGIQCATPTYNLASGTYNAPIVVAISTTTSGATINYTTDGTTPTETNGTVYTGPVAISVNTTLQAIAFKTSMVDSAVASQPYAIQCVAPTITVTSTQPLSLTIATTTPGATIRYTTDGSVPTETHGTVYSGPVLPTASGTLKALAYLSTMADSPVAAQAYTLTSCATPTYNLASNTYSTPQQVTISTPTSGATICYTMDGSTPTETHGTVYTGPVTISTNVTLQSLAWEPGMGDSAVATRSYAIQCAAPTFSASGSTPQLITLSTTTPGATIRYTTDGSTPSETAGTIYTGPVSITANVTMKTLAYASNMVDSPVVAQAFVMNTCAMPTFSMASSTYPGPISLSMSTITVGATMRYTTDGTTPSETNGIIYTGPVTLSTNTAVQVIAYESGMTDSAVDHRTFDFQCASPTFSLPAGTYTGAQTVSLSSTTAGATIRYTLDGTTPSETNGSIYSGPVTISATATLQTIAYLSGMVDSAIATHSYVIK